MKIAVITLGCPKNLVDSEVILGLLDEAGHRLVAEPAQADVTIVNTCAFISAAVEESSDVIRQCLALRRNGLPARVIVAGCMPQRFGRSVFEWFPDVDAVVGCSAFLEMADVVRQVFLGRSQYRVTAPQTVYDHLSPRVLGTPDHLAYVKIAEGCGNNCSYCTIPSIRGALRSRAPDSVVAEVNELAALGVKEVNVIAQDTTAYGTDIASDVKLPRLLSRIASIGVPWVRLMYTHPAHVTDELLSVMASEKRVVPYLDVPIQHISDSILTSMGRAIDGAGIRSLLHQARSGVPGITIRSSVIVGFPGESEADFVELLAFIEEGAVDYLGVFEYSPEPGTPAFDLPARIPQEETSARASAIVAAMENVAVCSGRRRDGESVTVLIDDVGDRAVGRTAGQAWEVDGRVLLRAARNSLTRGAFVEARITGVDGFDLLAVPLLP